MTLLEQINRINSMMGLNESQLPVHIRRRLKLNEDEILQELKGWLMRFHEEGKEEITMSKAFTEATWWSMTPLEEDLYVDEVHQIVKEFLMDKYKDEMLEFQQSLFGGQDDDGVYCFIKHSERYGGLQSRGFSECVNGWYAFLKKYGYWLPHLDWNGIHKKLNEVPSKEPLLLARPLEKHVYEYYFSILKR